MSVYEPSAPRAAFTSFDRAPEELRKSLVGYLDAAARHPEVQRMRSAALELFAPAEGERLLDAGCGLGEAARQLGARVGARGEVTALDSSAELISLARSRDDGTPVEYVVGDLIHLGLPDGHFDGVRSERVIQHLPDPAEGLRELVRVTRPGGRLCVIDTDWTSSVYDGFDHLDEVLRVLFAAEVFAHPSFGRTVRSRMVAAGLRGVTTLPVTLRFTCPGDAASVVPFFNHQTLPPDLLPKDLCQRFYASADLAAGRGDFLFAFTMWISVGRVAVSDG